MSATFPRRRARLRRRVASVQAARGSRYAHGMRATVDLTARAEAWLADDPDDGDRAELRAVLEAMPDSAADLADRFAGPLTFGTAGLRGPLRAGPAGMNLAV